MMNDLDLYYYSVQSYNKRFINRVSSCHTMLLLTNCEVHTGKYLDRSFEVRTERNEVHTKN